MNCLERYCGGGTGCSCGWLTCYLVGKDRKMKQNDSGTDESSLCRCSPPVMNTTAAWTSGQVYWGPNKPPADQHRQHLQLLPQIGFAM